MLRKSCWKSKTFWYVFISILVIDSYIVSIDTETHLKDRQLDLILDRLIHDTALFWNSHLIIQQVSS